MVKKKKIVGKPDSSNIEEMKPLNSELYIDFSLDELEERLEMETWGCVKCDCNGLSPEPPPTE